MTYTEKKRWTFFGLPWTFTTYTVTDEVITINSGFLRRVENDCYLYKVVDRCAAGERTDGAALRTWHDPLLQRRCDRSGPAADAY